MAAFQDDIPLPDVTHLQIEAREELVTTLKSMSGIKDLVLDADLMRPMDRITTGAALLKEHGVDKIYRLDVSQTPSIQGSNQVMFIIRPRVPLVQNIAKQIQQANKQAVKRNYMIVFVPRKLYSCERILEQEGIYGDVRIAELSLDFIRLDKDVLSLELPHFFNNFYLDSDQTWCHSAARGLVTLQQMFGGIPNIYGQGRCAKVVSDIADMIFEDPCIGAPNYLQSQIGHVFLIDRDVDLVTPLCSQVAYEGLLDDTFGIKSSYIEFGREVTGNDGNMKLILTSSDEVFNDIRDKHFTSVFSFLSGKAKDVQSGYDKSKSMKSVSQMKDYVANDLKGLKQAHKSLTIHISACEYIMKSKAKGEFESQICVEHSLLEGSETRESIQYIEEMINKQCDMYVVLRLLCLLSLTQNGISSQTYRALKTQFLHSYGFEHLIAFNTLHRLGMLVEQDSGQSAAKLGIAAALTGKNSNHKQLCKKLNLLPKHDQVNLKQPNDMSYVFSGAYTPLSCKLVELVLQKQGFTGLEDIVKLLPGPHFYKSKAKSAKSGPSASSMSQVVLVYFLGGCTFSEISALRLLGRTFGKQKGYKFLIATTGIINCNSIVENVINYDS